MRKHKSDENREHIAIITVYTRVGVCAYTVYRTDVIVSCERTTTGENVYYSSVLTERSAIFLPRPWTRRTHDARKRRNSKIRCEHNIDRRPAKTSAKLGSRAKGFAEERSKPIGFVLHCPTKTIGVACQLTWSTSVRTSKNESSINRRLYSTKKKKKIFYMKNQYC